MSFFINFVIYLRVIFYRGNNINDDVIYISTFIKNNTSKDDKISVYGNWNIIYILIERFSSSRYSYKTPLKMVDNRIHNEYFLDLENNLLKYIIV